MFNKLTELYFSLFFTQKNWFPVFYVPPDNEINNIPSELVNISTSNTTALQAGTTPGNTCTGSGKFNSDGSEMSSVTSESIPAG